MPGKKMLHKLLYLMKRKGFDAEIDYYMHYFGPYSKDLSEKLFEYDADYIIDIDTSGVTHTVTVIKQDAVKDISDKNKSIINDVLEKYLQKTPSDLELLTTADFVAHTLLAEKFDGEQDIIDEVMRIKGSKFSKDEIKACISYLKKDKLITV